MNGNLEKDRRPSSITHEYATCASQRQSLEFGQETHEIAFNPFHNDFSGKTCPHAALRLAGESAPRGCATRVHWSGRLTQENRSVLLGFGFHAGLLQEAEIAEPV